MSLNGGCTFMKVELSAEQKRRIKDCFGKLYPTYKESKEFKQYKESVLSYISYFREKLPKRVDDFSEIDLVEVLSNTFTMNMPGSPQYRAQKMIAENGIQRIRKAFKILLDTSIPPHERYGKIRKMNVKGIGPVIITEMLAYLHPHECATWNNVKSRKRALSILNIDITKWKTTLNPQEYKTFNEILKAIQKELNVQEPKIEKMGLLFTNYFILKLGQQSRDPESEVEFSHDEMRDRVRDIGSMLGFDAETEVTIAPGARVDVVWSARIGNLGIVNYIFEVHKSGSIDSLLMNLQKAKSSPTVQKVVAISDKVQLEKIKEESEGLPEEFRRDLTFWPVEEVLKVAEHLESAMKIIDGLNLTPEPFK